MEANDEKPAIAVSGGYVQANSVIQGDCINVMSNIEDKSIDMILCDLPYGVTNCKWDDLIPLDQLWEQYERIIKENGAIVLTATQPFATDLINSNRKLFKYDIIWSKNQPSGILNAKRQFLRSHEGILIFYKKQPTYNPQYQEYSKSTKDRYEDGSKIKIGNNLGTVYSHRRNDSAPLDYKRGRHPGSVLDIKCVHNGNFNRLHPTQKPVELFEFLVKTFTNQGETILDNCAGSGTTAEACLNNNRNYILIEKEEKYIEVINERIRKIMKAKSERFDFDTV